MLAFFFLPFDLLPLPLKKPPKRVKKPNAMTLTDACCNTQPTNAEWQAKGEDKVLSTKVDGHERKVYRTGPRDSKRGIIAIHDPLG